MNPQLMAAAQARRAVRKISSRYFATKIPPPTWSVASLGLDQKRDPVSREELETLARRALLHPNNELRQDLGNMLHLIRQVQDTPPHPGIYKGGVERAPFRDEPMDEEEVQKVWESYLEPQTEKVGGHSYFAIQTGAKKDGA